METRIKQFFDGFLYPLFDDVLQNDFKGLPDKIFESLITETSNLFFQRYFKSFPIENEFEIELIIDKFIEEYLALKS